MTKHRLIAILIVSAATSLPAAAASAPVPISKERIALAIAGTGMRVSPEQVTLLNNVVATTKTPVLQIESVEHLSDNRARVRLNCASHADCMPFFVLVQSNPETAVHETLASSELPTGLEVAKPGPRSYVVRAGSPAILLLDGGHVHIRLTVVCLQDGAAGQTIRVASKDRKQTYTAQVTDSSILRGKL
jgi:Chaperone for flagella basal body P-ring formation